MARPNIPQNIRKHLWLRAGGRCEFRGCNKILYEDNVTQDPMNGSQIAHIISWTKTGPRGDAILSPKLATDITNLMLTCPEHNHLIDSGENVEKYTVSFLQEMKKEHEDRIRELTGLGAQPPKRVIEFISMIHGHRPSITENEEANALFPFYPHCERIVIDLCDTNDLETAKSLINTKVNKHIFNDQDNGIYAAFIMALIPLSCYFGYVIGNTVPVKTYQHFRDTEDWKWRECGEGYDLIYPSGDEQLENVNVFLNISGTINRSLVDGDYPTYFINAKTPGVCFLQAWDQVIDFRLKFRCVLDEIRNKHGEGVIIHLYPATPNPISFEIGKSILKNLDPTIILYDKTDNCLEYKKVMYLHQRIRS